MIKNKIAFRFIILVFVLWLFPFPLGNIPFLDSIAEFVENGVNWVVLWFGNDLLQLSQEVNAQTTGSGDKLYDYVRFLFVLVLAGIGTIIWILLQRKPLSQEVKTKIQYWFLVYLRYYLAAVMLGYGLAKVFVLQFSEPGFTRLITEFGDFSPMGVVWTFMGQSKGYTILSGVLEVIGGLLLLHRRTVNLGTLIIIIVTSNIIALNVFYDVPVKLYAIRYVAIGLLILLPDISNIIKTLLGYGGSKPKELFKPFGSKKWFLATRATKWILLIAFVGYSSYTTYGRVQQFGYLAPKPELYGLYEVQEYNRNGKVLPPLLTDSLRLRYIAIDRSTFATLLDMKKQKTYYRMSKDSISNELLFANYRDSTDIYTFKVTHSDSLFTFKGYHQKDTLILKTIRYNKDDFLINQRPFKWIQERPFNR
ncbi:hypothetical protein ACOKFD_08835 [Flagellimonas sp. S174]|uniref:hypothetical protein n=1 Tax=Flagellimonas sp. S174 TaxID=3410790 RepID=UPI003BF4F8DD